MSKDNKNENEITSLRAFAPGELVAHQIASDMTRDAQLHDMLSDPEISPEELARRRNLGYMVTRNSLEEALGVKEPYASGEIAELRATGELPPENTTDT